MSRHLCFKTKHLEIATIAPLSNIHLYCSQLSPNWTKFKRMSNDVSRRFYLSSSYRIKIIGSVMPDLTTNSVIFELKDAIYLTHCKTRCFVSVSVSFSNSAKVGSTSASTTILTTLWPNINTF